MTIDFKMADVLSDKWWELTKGVLRENTFDKEAFIALFKETFEALRHCSCEDSVDKRLIDLIKNASGFVATRFTRSARLDYDHPAACELTDAMLTNCLQGERRDKPITKGRWTLLTTEIEVDFLKADDMLFNFSVDLAWADFSPDNFADDC